MTELDDLHEAALKNARARNAARTVQEKVFECPFGTCRVFIQAPMFPGFPSRDSEASFLARPKRSKRRREGS